MQELRVIRSSVVPVPRDEVWARITTPEGINYELGPILKMTVPRALAGATVGDVAVGEELGRSWVKLFGLIPVDYDDLKIVELEPGARFLERSRTLQFDVWQHERSLADAGSGTRVTDRLTFRMRPGVRWFPGASVVAARAVDAIFRHRHKRLRSYFSRG